MINLKKGEGVNLSKPEYAHISKYLIEVDWDVNTSARSRSEQFEINVGGFILANVGGKPQAKTETDFVFYGNAADANNILVHNPDNWRGGTDIMHLDTDALISRRKDAMEVSVWAEIYEGLVRGQDFGHVNHVTVTISDEATGQKVANFRLTEDDADSTIVQLGSFVVKNGDLHFEAVGKGYRKGWADPVVAYGLQVGEAE